jgi:cytochrome c oxidase assembly protein subunit 15
MLRPTVSLRAYQQVSLACLVSLYAIIVTGSLVRLTGSGLGCADWPRCSDQRFVDVSTAHAAIEQINRLFTGVVAVAVVAAALLSLLLRPRQKQLVWLSLGLVAGDMAHYLVSILLVTTSFTLLVRVRELGSDSKVIRRDDVSRLTRRLIRLIVALLVGVLVAGTVVTGSGPHAGDETAPRFSFSIQTVTRIHGAIVWAALVVVILVFVRIRRIPGEWGLLSRSLETLIVVLVAQGFLGYFQYFLDVPAGLVAIHVGVSVAVWIAALALLNSAGFL